MEQDYQLRLHLRDMNGVAHVEGEFQLVSTDYPSSQWQPGQLFQEWYDLSTDKSLPTGEMLLTLNLLADDGRPVLARSVTVAEVWVQSRKAVFQVPEITAPRAVNMGDRVTFLGYDLQPLVRAGEDLPVSLRQSASRSLPLGSAGLALRNHVLDPR